MGQNDRTYSEKRDFIRMRLESPVTLHHAAGETAAVCLDLSSTGMQIEADATLSIGDKVRVTIASTHTALSGLDADAEVVRVNALDDGRMSIGLTIITMR